MVITDSAMVGYLRELVRARDAAASAGDDTCPAFEVEFRIFDAMTRRAWAREKVLEAMRGQLPS